MRIEEQYMPVLKSIESSIVAHYRTQRDMTDYSVMAALEAAISHYKAVHQHRVPRTASLPEKDARLFTAIKEACDKSMAQITAPGKSGQPGQPLSAEEMMACLKRLLKSVQFWNKESGRQGYLNYVVQFV